MGAGALASNTIGIDNTATGSGALYNNTTGNSNTATGESALTFDFATAGNATFVLNPGTGLQLDPGEMGFSGNATAGNGIFVLNPTTGIEFHDSATGRDGFFMNMGGGVDFGFTFTGLITTAGNATIINEGGNGAGSYGGATFFYTASTAGQALLVANGGENGGGPGFIKFNNDSDGGEAQIEVYGDGYIDISFRLTPSVTIGSLAGDGFAYLGSKNLTVGSNNLSTTFSGRIQDGGSLEKIGNGTQSLGGANTYAGGTTISGGTLLVKNSTGSATGTGTVRVSGGTLGGRGIIAGPTTIGAGNGRGGSLQPGKGASNPTTLTIQNTLTFKSDSTYTGK